jgi:6-phosphofructokinase
MGYEAVETVLAAKPEDEPQMIAIRGNRIITAPLMKCGANTVIAKGSTITIRVMPDLR